MSQTTVVETSLSGLKLLGRGKVRDIYEVDGKLLLVASDRLSAFDVVMPDGIPGKGKVLTQISAFWFGMLSGHRPQPHDLHRRRHLSGGRRACMRRHCAAGRCCAGRRSRSPWSASSAGTCPVPGGRNTRRKARCAASALPKGLRESDRLPEPIFTPATKEEKGKHDENISFERMVAIGRGGDGGEGALDRRRAVRKGGRVRQSRRGSSSPTRSSSWGPWTGS